MIMRFENLEASIVETEDGDILEIEVPSVEIPRELPKSLDFLRPHQRDEIITAACQMAAMNYIMEHHED